MKRKGLFLAAAAVIAAVYVLMVYMLLGFDGHGNTFWFSFGAELFSLVFVTGVLLLIARDGKTLQRAVVLGYSLAKWSVWYLVAELAASTVFIIVDRFFTAAVLIQALLFAAFLVVVILCRFARSAILNVQDERREKQFSMKNLAEEAAMLKSAGLTGELGKAVEKLADDIRFSDTISSPETEILEERILMELTTLRSICRKDQESAMEKVDQIEELLARRNILAKSSKKRY